MSPPGTFRKANEVHFSLSIDLSDAIFVTLEANVALFGAKGDFRRQLLWEEKCDIGMFCLMLAAEGSCTAA